ncbi:MAG: OmpA family protein [Bacteroidales bacterium]|nr:OmpA family protein [Bacteroidales bacterium]
MKRLYIFLFTLCFTLPFPAITQIRVDLNKKINREANRRANRQADKAVDKSFDKVEEGIGSIFKKKNDHNTPKQESVSSQIEKEKPEVSFGSFTRLSPADGDVTTSPISCSWEIPNMESYTFMVHLEGDDWSDWFTKTTNENKCSFTRLPTATKNLKWKIIAEGNGERLESPWQNFTVSDGTDDAPQTKPEVQWAKFDFVPGDEVIFEDGPGQDEENGEFPSRWDLLKGQVEIAGFDGETVIMFLDGGEIIPYLKNSDTDYLPEVFTIEFDFYRPQDGNRITVYLTDQKNQRGLYDDTQEFDITPTRVDAPGGITVEHSGRDYHYCEQGCWTHISIAFTKGKLKVYIDDTRVINIPHYEFNPTGFTFYPYFADAAEGKAFYAKNFRIAKGGVKYYDRVLSDGKIIVNGIRFDVNKSTIKPESNGAINEIFELMQKQTDLDFSVEGHTDSDGDETFNQTLSENRAKAVMERLMAMGISAHRLQSAGWGESKPLSDNATPEQKANNRRVEFVKF